MATTCYCNGVNACAAATAGEMCTSDLQFFQEVHKFFVDGVYYSYVIYHELDESDYAYRSRILYQFYKIYKRCYPAMQYNPVMWDEIYMILYHINLENKEEIEREIFKNIGYHHQLDENYFLNNI